MRDNFGLSLAHGAKDLGRDIFRRDGRRLWPSWFYPAFQGTVEQLRLGSSWAYDQHIDPVARQLGSNCLTEPLNGELGRTIVASPGDTAVAQNGADIDEDRPIPGFQKGEDRIRQLDRCEKVQLHDLAKPVGRHILKPPQSPHPCIVDQEIESTKVLTRCGNELGSGFRICQIYGDGDDFRSVACSQRRQFVESLGTSCRKDQAALLADHQFRQGSANAAGRSGNDSSTSD